MDARVNLIDGNEIRFGSLYKLASIISRQKKKISHKVNNETKKEYLLSHMKQIAAVGQR